MIGRRTFLAGPAAAAGSLSANSAVSVGIIGTGRRGRYVGGMFAKDPRVRIAAVCDIYDDQIDAAKTEIPATAGARVYKDYRELLASPAIDAVYIATPVFLHPEHFEAAVQARKHVYCEKPAGADVAGVHRVMRAGAAADPAKHTAFGLQRRYAPHYRAAAEIVTSARFGRLLFMKSNWVSWGVLAKNFTPNPAWGAEERRIRYWPHFRETSGDFIVEQDCHGVDVLNWFAGSHPVKAVGVSGRGARVYGDDSDWFNVTFSYPGALTGLLVGTQLCQNRFSDVKEQFMCLDGTVETHLNYYRLHRGASDVRQLDARYDITEDAVRDFTNKVIAGASENTTAAACESTLTAFMGRLATETGREVTWGEVLPNGPK